MEMIEIKLKKRTPEENKAYTDGFRQALRIAAEITRQQGDSASEAILRLTHVELGDEDEID